jgi:hypothetical protein
MVFEGKQCCVDTKALMSRTWHMAAMERSIWNPSISSPGKGVFTLKKEA